MDTHDEMTPAAGTREAATPVPLWRRPLVLGSVGAVAAAAVVIAVVVQNGGDDAPPAAATTVTYEVAGSGVAQSCMPVADIQPVAGADALAGTVVSVEDVVVVLDVDRWYTGGDADRVEVRGIDQNVALDGVEFVVGDPYLVTAVDGVVQVCGVSGPATPELEQLYTEWYG
jgi:hypothetical protein